MYRFRELPAVLLGFALLTGAANATIEEGSVDTDSGEVACKPESQALHAMQSDGMFHKPFVDQDEWRNEPVRHRYVHGGFEGTETRFSLYLPPKDQYDGRFFQYITPVPMNENLSQGASGEEDKIGFAIDSGAYFIETNGGGMAAMMRDASIAAYRANAAVAQYSRVVAMQMYGCQRPYGYSFGGSGGGYRAIGGMENTEGVWDGAVPYVIGSPMAIPNVFTVRMYALRVLDDKLPALADAVDVGSEVEPAGILDEDEYAAFQEVTKMGFPREAWYTHDMLDLHGYASLFPGVVSADPAYFNEDFWNKPGYEGYEPPLSLTNALVEHDTTIKRLIFPDDAEELGLKASFLGKESKGLADDAWKSMVQSANPDTPLALQLASAPDKDLLGADLKVKSGAGEGGSLLVTRAAGNLLLVGSKGGEILSKLKAGENVQINNRDFLASQTYHRHQVPPQDYPVYDQFRDAQGKPVYPQRPFLLGPRIVSGAAGSVPDGDFKGKMIVLSNLHDTEAYPWQGDWYYQAARSQFGEGVDERLRLWYTDNAFHGDVHGQLFPARTVSYLGVLQQALRDVSAWVEEGVAPPSTSGYEIVDGQVVLANSAKERGAIQPVIVLTANNAQRAEVKVGEAVMFTAGISAPPNAGKVVAAGWDFKGKGEFVEAVLDKTAESITVATEHTFAQPGTYFVGVRAAVQRTGDTTTPFARIKNIARVRVVVE